MAQFPSTQKLNFWAENGYNVLFSGPHGVGKTAVVEETFNNSFGVRGVDWMYFSGATMDPWVDFIGVPKEKIQADGLSVLELIRPEVFARDQIKAIFIDELNRTHKKVRNAIMELMQFKSINGHKFNNLKVVWAAVNPVDDPENNYDVEEIDPAQLDRFHIHFNFKYDVSVPYFLRKYADEGVVACEWWRGLTEPMRKSVSPRRLDYVLDMHKRGGAIEDVLPDGLPRAELLAQLNSGSFKNTLQKIVNGELSEEEIKESFSDNTFSSYVEKEFSKNTEQAAKILPYMGLERFNVYAATTSMNRLKATLSNIDGKQHRKFVEAVKQEYREVNNRNPAKTQAIRNWLEAQGASEVFTYEGSDPELGTFFSDGVWEENTHYREKRIAAFLNFLGEKQLENEDEKVQKLAVEVWKAMISRSHNYTLPNKIRELLGVSLNRKKRLDKKNRLRAFFMREEFLPHEEKLMEVIDELK